MITVLTGANHFERSAYLANLQAEFVEKHGDMAIEHIDAGDISAEHIMSAIKNPPLLSAQKLVIISDAENLKEILADIEKMQEQVPETNQIVLIGDFDKRQKYVKGLQKHANFKEFNETKGAGLTQWIIQKAKEKDGSITQATAQFLIEYVGTNQNTLAHELDKLILYQPEINRETIELLCEPQPSSTVFMLLDAAFEGKPKEALQLYEDQRAQQVEPLAIVAMIAWQLHILSIVKTAPKDVKLDQISKDTKLHSFVLQKASRTVKQLRLSELKKLIQRTINLEIDLKSKVIDADDAVKQFLLQLPA